jgi:hypothetical protein
MADATVYLILFISVSGVYLWYVLRAERSVGFILLFAGALSFFGMAYALSPLNQWLQANRRMSRDSGPGFERWNRKLHFYAGLFLLFFLWLFAFSGLLLNHPSWSFAEFWNNRRQTNYEREIDCSRA